MWDAVPILRAIVDGRRDGHDEPQSKVAHDRMKPRYGIVDASVPCPGLKYPTFGKPPFDDVGPGDPLFGKLVMDVPEYALIHAAALGLLPEWDRYWSHLLVRGHDAGGPASHASSALRRLTRVLLQQERMRRITSHVPTVEESDELLDILTLVFVHLMGAFDALALVAAEVIGIEVEERNIAWQSQRFFNPLAAKAPTLAALFAPQSEGARSLAAIRTVRNTIHKQMPNPAQVHRDGGDPAHDHTSILFERGAHDEVLKALDAAGWSRFIFKAGVHPESLREAKRIDIAGVTRTADILAIRPDNLFSTGLSDGVPLLNAIMAATPVETLGEPIALRDPGRTLYPLTLRRYAVDKYRLTHLAKHLGVLPDIEDTEP